jgi:V/A-type H+/Na+-transporting ATPase subunit E
MEEIVSADAIKREILEDARKKATHLLEESEAEAARNVEEIEAKAAEVVEEIFQTNAAKSARYRMETMARFPLERTRMRTTFVDGKLREAVGAYVAALPETRVASLSEAMLAEGASFFEGKAIELGRKGLTEQVAREVAGRAFAKAASVSQVEDPSLPARGLVARALDGSVILRATMDLVEGRLLDRKRGELALSLCAEALSIGSIRGHDTDAAGRPLGAAL